MLSTHTLQVLPPIHPCSSHPCFLQNTCHRSRAWAVPALRTHLSPGLPFCFLNTPSGSFRDSPFLPETGIYHRRERAPPGGHFSPQLDDKRSTLTTSYCQPILQKATHVLVMTTEAFKEIAWFSFIYFCLPSFQSRHWGITCTSIICLLPQGTPQKGYLTKQSLLS